MTTPVLVRLEPPDGVLEQDRKSTRLNSSHQIISYAVFCLQKKSAPRPLRLLTHRLREAPFDHQTPDHVSCPCLLSTNTNALPSDRVQAFTARIHAFRIPSV